MNEDWLIWSNEHAGWWRPHHAGYTDHRELAGRYSFDEAKKIVRGANEHIKWEHFPNEKTPIPNEAMIPADAQSPDTKTEQKVIIRKVNENERKVLVVLADSYHPDEWSAYSFKGLIAHTKLELKDVKRSCRSLAKKGLAAYERSLVDGDGMMAGSGYRATEEGAALISPCDICGKRATYDYNVEADGTQTSNDDEKTRHVRECDDHYKQSAANPPAKQEALI